MTNNIFDYVQTEKTAYESTPIPVADGFEWHMPEHLKKCILYKDGRLLTGNSDDKPVKNIILPILNVQYRTEGFDVKDIEPYVNSVKDFHKSFLVRKFHDKWARDNSIDTFIDDLVMSYVDFGGALVKNVGTVRPEVIPLQKLAFCDQTDILSGPFAIKHQFSIDQLKEKSNVWDAEAIKTACMRARTEKSNDQSQGRKTKTPGKYIEVYEVHGVFPKSWLTDKTEYYSEYDEDEYSRQIHIICYSMDKDNRKEGITLFRGKEKDDVFKLIKRDKRFGTALGRSAIEELFEPQVWTNYNLIQIKNMLDKASMMLGVTDDISFTAKNKLTDLEQGEWLIKAPNTSVEPFVFPTVNLQQFEQAVIGWENHARTTGSANEAQLGVSPSSGTPFKLQELVTQEGRGIHEYRRGQIATFMEEIYRDWILPRMVTEMNKGQKLMTELTLDELQEVADKVVDSHVFGIIKKKILSGGIIPREAVEIMKTQYRDEFIKSGTKKFIEIMKDELNDIPVDVMMNVAGKQKNLVALVDKLSNIVRQVIGNPAILQDPNAAKLLNTIFEASGISPISFNQTPTQPMQPMQSPVQELPTAV